LHQVSDLFELNVKLRCQNVNMLLINKSKHANNNNACRAILRLSFVLKAHSVKQIGYWYKENSLLLYRSLNQSKSAGLCWQWN